MCVKQQTTAQQGHHEYIVVRAPHVGGDDQGVRCYQPHRGCRRPTKRGRESAQHHNGGHQSSQRDDAKQRYRHNVVLAGHPSDSCCHEQEQRPIGARGLAPRRRDRADHPLGSAQAVWAYQVGVEVVDDQRAAGRIVIHVIAEQRSAYQ